uniref:Methyltransferase FkbM domain-containing protein n=1 Tax=Alexandrium monilatum TaxID=311494 RepID=A0A7S4Q824_9DINO
MEMPLVYSPPAWVPPGSGVAACPPLSLGIGADGAIGVDGAGLEELSGLPCASPVVWEEYNEHQRLLRTASREIWDTAAKLPEGGRQPEPRRRAVSMRLLETMAQLECILFFAYCLPPGDAETSARVLCGLLQEELEEIAEIDQEDYVLSLEVLHEREHPCVTGRGSLPETLAAHHLLVRLFYRHARHAPALAQSSGSSSFGPRPALPWVPPAGWSLAPVHSPGGICGCRDLLWWHRAPALSSQISSPTLNETGWVVNFGAGDGSCTWDLWRRGGPYEGEYSREPSILTALSANDPANCILQQGHGGLLFEWNESTAAVLAQRHSEHEDLTLLVGQAEPAGAASLAAAYAVTAQIAAPLHLLKVDVDNCDCCFVEAILEAGLRPTLIHVEVHSLIPPPIIFRPLSQSWWVWDPLLVLGATDGRQGHMTHCSLSAFEDMLRPRGYRLVRLISYDAVFVSTEALAVEDPLAWHSSRNWGHSCVDTATEALWFGSYHCHPLRPTAAPEALYQEEFLYDYRRWNDPRVAAEARVADVRAYLERWGVPADSYLLGLDPEVS